MNINEIKEADSNCNVCISHNNRLLVDLHWSIFYRVKEKGSVVYLGFWYTVIRENLVDVTDLWYKMCPLRIVVNEVHQMVIEFMNGS